MEQILNDFNDHLFILNLQKPNFQLSFTPENKVNQCESELHQQETRSHQNLILFSGKQCGSASMIPSDIPSILYPTISGI